MPNITVPLEIAGDALSTSSTILTPGTLSADNVIVRVPLTATFGVSAVVTGISFGDVKSGAPIFTAGAAGQIFNAENDQSFPQQIRFGGGASSSPITVSLSAIGQPCALGAQRLLYVISLSSEALSGNGSGYGVRVDVTNTTDTTQSTTVTATNEAFGNRLCFAEHRRLVTLEA